MNTASCHVLRGRGRFLVGGICHALLLVPLLIGPLQQNLRAQPPDCVIVVRHLTGTGTAPPSGGFDNRVQGCQVWSVFFSSSGFTAVTMALQSAPDAGGVPGAFVTFAGGTVLTGTNPLTSAGAGGSAAATIKGYNPWVQANVTSTTGSGVIDGAVLGWKIPSASAGAGTGPCPGGLVNSIQTNNGAGGCAGPANFSISSNTLFGAQANWTVTDGNLIGPTNATSWEFTNNDNNVGVATGFSNSTMFQLNENVNNGMYFYGGGTNAKTTTNVFNMDLELVGSTQAFGATFFVQKYSMGDVGAIGETVNYWGGPFAGDEGQGWQLVTHLAQVYDRAVPYASINSATRSNCPSNMTVTNAITGDNTTVQTLLVSSTTGCATGDWMVLGQAPPTATPNEDNVQITVVDGTHVSGIFAANQLAGVTMTPALVLVLGGNSTLYMGQNRVLVNTDAASLVYNTGTFSATTGVGGQVNFTGTAFTNNMVGGNANNIGALSLAQDDLNAGPFSGGANNVLHSYYQIVTINSGTQLVLFSNTVAGDATIRTLATSGGAYQIKPACRILRIIGGTVICETTPANASNWQAGQSVQAVACPFPDVTGFSYALGSYTPGATNRAWTYVLNYGARTFTNGLLFAQAMIAGGNADLAGFGTPISITSTSSIAGLNLSGRVFGDTTNFVDGVALKLVPFTTDGVHRQDPKLIMWSSTTRICLGGDPSSSNLFFSSNCIGTPTAYASLNTALFTGPHTYQFPDKGGTFAMLSDTSSPGALTRTIPATLNNEVDIGSFDISANHSASFAVAIQYNDGVTGDGSRSYNFSVEDTGSNWVIVNPISSAFFVPSGTPGFTFEVNSNRFTLSMRLRSTGNANATTANLNIAQRTPVTTFTPASGTSLVTAPTVYLDSGMILSSLQSASSAPAVNAAGCAGATLGTGSSNVAGTLTALPGAACSVILTFKTSTGANLTAPHGWNCAVSDQTTANQFRQTASTASTVTFGGTSAAADVLAYGPCVGW